MSLLLRSQLCQKCRQSYCLLLTRLCRCLTKSCFKKRYILRFNSSGIYSFFRLLLALDTAFDIATNSLNLIVEAAMLDNIKVDITTLVLINIAATIPVYSGIAQYTRILLLLRGIANIYEYKGNQDNLLPIQYYYFNSSVQLSQRRANSTYNTIYITTIQTEYKRENICASVTLSKQQVSRDKIATKNRSPYIAIQAESIEEVEKQYRVYLKSTVGCRVESSDTIAAEVYNFKLTPDWISLLDQPLSTTQVY